MNIEDSINIDIQRWALRDIDKAVKELSCACQLFLNICEADIGSAQSKKLDEYLTEILNEHCPYLTLDTKELYS